MIEDTSPAGLKAAAEPSSARPTIAPPKARARGAVTSSVQRHERKMGSVVWAEAAGSPQATAEAIIRMARAGRAVASEQSAAQ